MAEREGFEPPVPRKGQLISSLLSDYLESVARRFANPSRWMPWIETGAHVTDRDDFVDKRSVLIRWCYGSPDRMRPLRAYFTRSGFLVVDCPPLTTSAAWR